MLLPQPMAHGRLVARYKRFFADVRAGRRHGAHRPLPEPGRDAGAEHAGPGRLAVALGRAEAQAGLDAGAGRGGRRAGRRQHHAAQPAGRRGAGGGRDPRADRLRRASPRGALRRGQPGRLPAERPGPAAGCYAGGEELPPAARRDAGRVPRLRRGALVRSTCASWRPRWRAGNRAVQLFVVQRTDCDAFAPAPTSTRPTPPASRPPPTPASRCWSTPATSARRR